MILNGRFVRWIRASGARADIVRRPADAGAAATVLERTGRLYVNATAPGTDSVLSFDVTGEGLFYLSSGSSEEFIARVGPGPPQFR